MLHPVKRYRHCTAYGENVRYKTTGKEITVPKLRGGNCEKRREQHNVAGGGNARHEHSGKAEYRKPLIAEYRYTKSKCW